MKLKHRWLFFITSTILFTAYLIFLNSKTFYDIDKQPTNSKPDDSVNSLPVMTPNYTISTVINSNNLSGNILKQPSFIVNEEEKDEIVVCVVVCGSDRLAEALTVLKSAILLNSFTEHRLRLIVITEDNLNQNFNEKLSEWRSILNGSFEFELHHLSFPAQYEAQWKSLFKPCASQRLFLPTLLPHINKLLYVDTDVIFVAPLTDIWKYFDLMNSTQMAALSPEHEDPNIGWYNRFARHPFYGKMGVNSGVMLMHLSRMRQFGWVKYLGPIYKEFKLKLTWGDQDIINIFFHFHPEMLLVYSCAHNYRTDHCMYLSSCSSAEKDGIAVVHGSRGSFHNQKHPAFTAVYRAVEEYQMASDLYMNLLLPMTSYLEQTSKTACGKVRHLFTKRMEAIIKPNDIL